MKKNKVLVVDDSALVRKYIGDIITENPQFELMGSAADPYIAVQKMKAEKPDVITLDIEMPKMDGLTFLQRIMSQHPIPVVVISSLSKKGSNIAIRALEYGAVEVIEKPELNIKEFIQDYKRSLWYKIEAAAKSKVVRKRFIKRKDDAAVSKKTTAPIANTTDKVIAIGASTGGTEAIKDILQKCTPHTSGIVIVQHMPAMFTRQFAERLNRECDIYVKEAEPGDHVVNGKALIAPGNRHMILKRSGAKYKVDLIDGEEVNRHRPSVDVLFDSVAREAQSNCIAVLLTGMGNDGAKGLLNIKNSGAYTLAQDQRTSVVYGMPMEAAKLNAANKILSLESIGDYISSR